MKGTRQLVWALRLAARDSAIGRYEGNLLASVIFKLEAGREASSFTEEEKEFVDDVFAQFRDRLAEDKACGFTGEYFRVLGKAYAQAIAVGLARSERQERMDEVLRVIEGEW